MLFRDWEAAESARDNFQKAKERNSFGARTQGLLKEIVSTISSRFPDPAEVEPLIVLAKGEVGPEIWKACLHWYMASRDELYYRFVTEWLFSRYESGTNLLKPPDLEPFVRAMTAGRDLLRFGADFGLLTSGSVRQFALYRLPDEAFIFLTHVLLERELSPQKVINAPDWRICLMSPSDVERELLRLHQFRKLHYEVAGSLIELRLPSSSPLEYAKEISQCLAGKID